MKELTYAQARKNQHRQHRVNFLPSKPGDGNYFGKCFAKMGQKAAEIHDISETLSKKSAVKAFPMRPGERNSLEACECRKA